MPTLPDELTLEVDRVDRVARDVVTLTLVDPDAAPLPEWQPGAHVDLLIAQGLERQYSLCGDPRDRLSWRIGVLRDPRSRGGSQWVHDSIQPGARVRVRGPRNNFPLVPAGSYLMIAGGIGITPILPMVRELAATGADWRLLYGGRTRESMAFLAELAELGDAVSICPEDECGLLDLAGTLDAPRPDAAVYCCGPAPLLEAVENQCHDWPAGAVRFERFRPDETRLAGSDDAFEVALERSGITVTVSPGESIAEAVGRAGVDVPTSCREGTCGTCETDVLAGIPDHRDSVLSDAERAEGQTMMVCVSRSRTPRLELDL